ncbi:C25 family cysteine peptidase [candidate division WOR-3 bacterium]|nr:C25 family cysteine peptidase [candidate division WOR-3 bacterium]
MTSILLFLTLTVPGVEVLSSNEEGVVISYSPQFVSLDPIMVRGASYPQERGVPWLPEIYLYIAIPLLSEVRIQLISADIKERKQMEVLPVPKVDQYGHNYVQDPKIYKIDGLYPDNIISLKERGFIRGQEYIMVKLHPVRYNPKKEMVTIYERIKLRVSFEGGKRGERIPDPHFENSFRRLFVNYEDGRDWRKRSVQKIEKTDNNPWVKIELREKGIYRISYDDLRRVGMNPDFINPKSFRLWTQGGSMYVLPEDTLREVPIYIRDDAIYFYATSTAGQEKNPHTYLNIFTDINVYWLTHQGIGRRDSMSGAIGASHPYIPQEFTDTIRIEEDRICPAKSGRGWAWFEVKRVNVDSVSATISFNLPALATETAQGNFAIYGYTRDGASRFDPYYVRLYINDSLFSEESWDRGSSTSPHIIIDTVSNLGSGENSLIVKVWRGPEADTVTWVYFDYFELYPRLNYYASNGELRFRADQGDTIEFHLLGFPHLPLIFNIEDPLSPIRVVEVRYEDGKTIFQTTMRGPFYAATSFKRPLSITLRDPNNIRNIIRDRVDYLIITSRDFYFPASDLLRYREEKDGISGLVVFIDDIYNNFSFGLKTPWAIRNFLRFAYENWNTSYVLLLGSGTYVYRQNLARNIISPWTGGYHIGEFGLSPWQNPCYDNWFAMVSGDDGSPDMRIARITAETKEQVRGVVRKVVDYERAFGPWRGRVLLCSDDGDGGAYTRYAEDLYARTPLSYDVFKVYIGRYAEAHQTNKGNYYLHKYMNRGVYFGAYIGHGNLRRLAHEDIWISPGDIYRLTNIGKYPIFFYGSCGVGCFDRPHMRGTADYKQLIEGKGAIATIAATRSIFHGSSVAMGNPLFEHTVIEPVETIGEAFFLAILKSNRASEFILFGDPMTNISSYRDNYISVSPDSLIGGLRTDVVVSSGDTDSGFIYITAYGKEEWDTADGIRFSELGPVMFRGQSRLRDTVSFFTPLDIESGTGKVTGYLWNAVSGGGVGKRVFIADSNVPSQDTTGPEIEVFVEGRRVSIEVPIEVEKDFTISAILEDPSGIRLMEGGIMLKITGTPDPYHLEEKFEYDIGSSVRGELVADIELETPYPVDTLIFRAEDNSGNLSEFEFTLRKVFTERLVVENPINYPNPIRGDRTRIEFRSSKAGKGRIKIFTISGRLIRTLSIENVRNDRKNEKYWDIRDELGDRVGNGIYIYKIEVEAEGKKADCIGKMMVMR